MPSIISAIQYTHKSMCTSMQNDNLVQAIDRGTTYYGTSTHTHDV